MGATIFSRKKDREWDIRNAPNTVSYPPAGKKSSPFPYQLAPDFQSAARLLCFRYAHHDRETEMSWTTMQRLTIATALAAGLLASCDQPGQEPFPTTDALTPGIFLDTEERAVLPAGVELRPVYQRGIDLTKLSEGFRSRLYNDAAGYCTIAYGHLVKLARCDGSEPAQFLRGVTEPEGEQLLVSDMRTAQIAVMVAVQPELSDGQFAALCDFVFNVGSGNFRRSTLLKVINAEEFDKVPFQFRRWVY